MSSSAYTLDEVVLNFVFGRKILDVGCGLGRWGHLIRIHLQIKGIEPEIIGIDIRKEWLYKGDAEETIKLRRQDKGHRNHLVEFAKLVRGEQFALPSFEDYIYTMKVTFEIEKRSRKIY